MILRLAGLGEVFGMNKLSTAQFKYHSRFSTSVDCL
jgi:hypothetical protein